MSWITPTAWFALALVHLPPAAVLVRPALIETLYGTSATGDAGVLLVHRGALFLAVVVLCIFAAIEPSARRAASLVLGISVLGFLAVYTMAGMPAGALRIIALADAVALLPLGWVMWQAWVERGR